MRKILTLFQLIMLMVFAGSTAISAQDVSFSGWGAAGYRIFARNFLNGYNQEGYYEGKLQANIEFNKNIDAQLDFRGNSTDRSVDFREFSVKLKFFEFMNFKIGHTKRPFTYQYFIQNRESTMSIQRSLAIDRLNQIGYGGRSLSITAYNKSSEKKDEFPLSYYVSVFANNSLNRGAATRFAYHAGIGTISLNYLFQNTGGEETINAHGVSADYNFRSKAFDLFFELSLAQDPVEGVIRRLQKKDEKVYSAGGTIGAAYKFDVDGKIVKDIEPILLFSVFAPDSKIRDTHSLQTVIGFNIYFLKSVSARLNADVRFTKNQFNTNYSTKESRTIFEIFVDF